MQSHFVTRREWSMMQRRGGMVYALGYMDSKMIDRVERLVWVRVLGVVSPLQSFVERRRAANDVNVNVAFRPMLVRFRTLWATTPGRAYADERRRLAGTN